MQPDVWCCYRRVEAGEGKQERWTGVAETEAELRQRAAESGHRWIPGGPPQ